VQRALVIAGSDKRGTIYGIYTLSEQIGVSPWYWWADVPIAHHRSLSVPLDTRIMEKPTVQYRGLFLNDEAPVLTNWAKERFGGFNHKFYEKLFELMLRMRANYLWPAMWYSSFYDDDKENGKLADMMGIVMGTSHHEPMMRAQQEWKRYGKGPWDYHRNGAVLRDFWAQGLRNTRDYEKVITHGDARRRRRADVRERQRRPAAADRPRPALDHPEGARPGTGESAAVVGAVQGSAGVLREGHARPG
jgi:hypothetical protein